MCEWDGGHTVSAIRPLVAAWWLGQFVDAGSAPETGGGDAATSAGSSGAQTTGSATSGDVETTGGTAGGQTSTTTGGPTTSTSGGGGAPGGCEALDPAAFEVVFEVESDAFPLQPYCDPCQAFGVASNEAVADFVVRWRNGLDPRLPGDGDVQWIEQRPTHDFFPFVRVRAEAGTITLARSRDGIAWQSVISGPNPFLGTSSIEIFAEEPSVVLATSCDGIPLDGGGEDTSGDPSAGETTSADTGGGATQCGTLDGASFDVTFEVDSSTFPLQPYCDPCQAFGVTSGEAVADFVVRWRNGLDPRLPGDDDVQWIEQRPTHDFFPFVRIRADGPSISLLRSRDGLAWQSVISGANPFVGSNVELFSQEPNVLLSTSCR